MMSSGADAEGDVGNASLPSAIFNNTIDEYNNFSIISNLFDNNDRYVLRTHKWKMREQNTYLVKDSEIRAKNWTKFVLKIVQKAQNGLLQYVNFHKISWRACLQTPLQPFLSFNLLQINSAGKYLALKIRIAPLRKKS